MLGAEEKRAVAEVLDGPMLVHGPRAKAFEAAFAEYSGGGYAVSVSSGTAALHLIYLAKELVPGDEVIVPAQTHVATAHAVEYCGARPVFVDTEGATGNIDVDQIEDAVTERTRAISVVHFLGVPVEMDRVNAIAAKHGLFVVEDAALAVGTRYKGRHAGLLGDAGCFSFYPVKHMTTAEGGMLLTRDADLARRIERLKAFGLDRTVVERTMPGVYDVTMLGYNYRMNEIEAAIGIEQLKRVPEFLRRRRRNDRALRQGLAGIDEITLLESPAGEFESSCYCVSAVLDASLSGRRAEIVEALKDSAVGSSVYYPRPVPHMTYYREKYGYEEKSFPAAARISYQSIALPVGPHLDEADMATITEAFKDAVARSH